MPGQTTTTPRGARRPLPRRHIPCTWCGAHPPAPRRGPPGARPWGLRSLLACSRSEPGAARSSPSWGSPMGPPAN